MTLREYCNGCPKNLEGICSIYEDASKKVGADRGFSLGCAFSRITLSGDNNQDKKETLRVGQKKSKKKSKQKTWRTYSNRKSQKKSRTHIHASQAQR